MKPGREQKGWSIEAKCTGHGNGGGGCGAELLVEQADVYMTYTHCMGESDQHATFKCAACGVETDLRHMPPFSPPDKPRRSSQADK